VDGGGWRKEERLPPSHARGGDALPLPVEEEGSFHELRLAKAHDAFPQNCSETYWESGKPV